MKKGLPTQPGWYWVEHRAILNEGWWEIVEVVERGEALWFWLQTQNYTGWVLVGRLEGVTWYGPILKPE